MGPKPFLGNLQILGNRPSALIVGNRVHRGPWVFELCGFSGALSSPVTAENIHACVDRNLFRSNFWFGAFCLDLGSWIGE